MTAQELVAVPAPGGEGPAAMQPVQRPVGANDVGIVAWRLTLRTPECPSGREVASCGSTQRREDQSCDVSAQPQLT